MRARMWRESSSRTLISEAWNSGPDALRYKLTAARRLGLFSTMPNKPCSMLYRDIRVVVDLADPEFALSAKRPGGQDTPRRPQSCANRPYIQWAVLAASNDGKYFYAVSKNSGNNFYLHHQLRWNSDRRR